MDINHFYEFKLYKFLFNIYQNKKLELINNHYNDYHNIKKLFTLHEEKHIYILQLEISAKYKEN